MPPRVLTRPSLTITTGGQQCGLTPAVRTNRTNRIKTDDVVEVLVKGRSIVGRVTKVDDGIVYFRPISPGAGWRHVKAREIVAHWRKTGRRGGGAEGENKPSTRRREQPASPGAPERAAGRRPGARLAARNFSGSRPSRIHVA